MFLKKYEELLNEYIKNSGLTLTDIGEELKKRGFSTDKSYLSKLRNGKIPPAGEDLNRALAEITGQDAEDLIVSAFLDKAPQKLKDIAEDFYQIEDRINRRLTKMFFHYKPTSRQLPEITNYLLSKGVNPYDNHDFSQQITSKLSIQERWELLWRLTAQYSLAMGSSYRVEDYNPPDISGTQTVQEIHNHLKELGKNDPSSKVKTIPMFDKVFHLGHFKEEDYQGTFEYEIEGYFGEADFISVRCFDNGLYDIDVIQGDQVIVQLTQNITKQDICLVTVGNLPGVLRKIQIHDDFCLLRPLNQEMDIELFPKSDVNILGRVIEVRKKRLFI
jgi:SOS-response transcriptional repressor LexA